MSVKEVATLLAIAQETGLEGADWAARKPLAEIVAAYNGIGADWMPAEVRAKITEWLSLFEPAALIHDLRYASGNGTREDFEVANMEFHGNCLKLARRTYPWWRFVSRRVAEKTAFALFKAVSSYFGWVAYRKACAKPTA